MASTHTPAQAHSDAYSTVRFWLKPHLHTFVQRLCGGGTIPAMDTHVIGAMALGCITAKRAEANRSADAFSGDRRLVHVRISLRMMEAHGYDTNSAGLARFERLVEHLFYHMMVVYVDQAVALGAVSQNEAIRTFLTKYGIDEGVEFDTFKKTLIRRRTRMETMTGKG